MSLSGVGGSLDWLEGDFGDFSLLEEAVSNVDVVFHLICTTLPKTSNDDIAYDVASNVVPTLKLLDSARKFGIKKVVFFSSGGTVYGIPEKIPIPENHPNNPICAYGIHKLTIEKYLHLYYVLHGLDYSVMRVANLYGENQRSDRGQGVVPVFIDKMLRGEAIEVWGEGTVVRDYIYVDDVVDAAIKIAEYSEGRKVFNIGSGCGISINDVIVEISRQLKCKPLIEFKPARSLDVPVNVLDISQAKKELDWRPKTPFSSGISLVLDRTRWINS
jgi:UDP-glucose 4-epimerase